MFVNKPVRLIKTFSYSHLKEIMRSQYKTCHEIGGGRGGGTIT